MTSEGEETLGVFKSNVEDMALEELSRLTVRRDTVASELKAIDSTIRSVRAVLGAVQPKQEKKPKKKQTGSTQISAKIKAQFLEWLPKQTGDITAKSIQAAFGVSDSYANMVAKQMRDEGYLRLSATSGSTNIYRAEG